MPRLTIHASRITLHECPPLVGVKFTSHASPMSPVCKGFSDSLSKNTKVVIPAKHTKLCRNHHLSLRIRGGECWECLSDRSLPDKHPAGIQSVGRVT
jgi:hypothetical protein